MRVDLRKGTGCQVKALRGGTQLDTPYKRTSHHGQQFGNVHRHHHHQHHHKGKDKDYVPKEFKKSKTPTFDGEVKIEEDAKAWLLGMKKFFRVHKYSKNMKEKVATFSLKCKAVILWEDLKNVRDTKEEELFWNVL